VSLIDINCVTPGDRAFMHRFYYTSPISPSGKYIAVMRFPYEDKSPNAGDYSRVLVLKLEDLSVVYSSETAAWDTQVGSHFQWGAADAELFFNRMDIKKWIPFGVKVDIFSGVEVILDGTVYRETEV
jgi:hypothetical protein